MITITSDWQKKDWYLSRLKGNLYSYFHRRGEEAVIDEISDRVPPHDIAQGCFLLGCSWKYYPAGTIHLLAVDAEPAEGRPTVVVSCGGHYFVSVDDGRFSLLPGVSPEAVRVLPLPEEFSVFAALGQMTEAVAAIAEKRISSLEERVLVHGSREYPAVDADRILGRVIYIDSYGNAITNIPAEMFARSYLRRQEATGRDPDFTIFVGGPYLKIDTICRNYTDAASGEELALFGSLGLLELAVRNGNFASLENVDETTEVVVKFD